MAMNAKLARPSRYRPFDSNARAYVAAVEAADGRFLDEQTARAINAFVLGCKADGIWSALKTCCILSGARTLSGALTPLVGAAPTSYNFVSGDYSRATGLKGDGVGKYLDVNRLADEDAQNDFHMAAMVTEVVSGAVLTSNPVTGTVGNTLSVATTSRAVRNQATSATTTSGLDYLSSTFVGHSRNSSSTVAVRRGQQSDSIISTSGVPLSQSTLMLRATLAYLQHRVAFYSLGAAVDLEKLESRVLTLMTAFASLS